ncbi:MAG: outer membrane protein assembly factor BamB, containings PQQ-like beta-propeller repeat [Chloroflexi bacterium]|nr:outer membrane protein assembly factor BamB, containings PQQ-like beta-propeller repeat [Chloroflexota bacterium]
MRLPRIFAQRAWHSVAVAVSLAAFMASAAPSATFADTNSGDTNSSASWPMFGQNFNNTASAPGTSISTENVSALKPKWVFTAHGDVSARAAVVNGVAYFPDWGGYLNAVNANNGHLIWQKSILADYFGGAVPGHAGVPKVVSRTSAFVDTSSNTIYIGTQTGAYLLAISTVTGSLKWKTQLDNHPLAIDTSSPIDLNGVIYVGVASLEEAAAVDQSYPCCSFRGSAMALNARTGAVIWKTYTIPSGYTGGSVWGSSLVPDPQRGVVYAATGNNYSTPTNPAYTNCVSNGGTQASCLSPDDHFDSILALNLVDGTIKWSQRLGSSDDWNVACFYAGNTNCPTGSGPDYDFGSGVNLFTIHTASGPKTIIGAGQKSGVYSAFDPDNNGSLLWATQVGPGSSLGGIEWGSATDGRRIYVAIGNFYGIPYTLQPSGQTDYAGSWSALDPATGHILWQTADPNGAVDLGPMTVANGVVYAPSMGANAATTQNMFALSGSTGRILWGFASGGSVIAGASVANDTVFWGSGYSNLGLPGYVGNNKFYAFTLGDQ